MTFSNCYFWWEQTPRQNSKNGSRSEKECAEKGAQGEWVIVRGEGRRTEETSSKITWYREKAAYDWADLW